MKTSKIAKKCGLMTVGLLAITAWSCGGEEDTGPGYGNDYPNGSVLVSAQWVQHRLDTAAAGEALVIVEAGWGEAGDYYTNGHVPGAIHVNTDEIEYDCFNARSDWPVDAGDPPCWDRSTTEEQDLAKGLGPDDSLPRNWWNLFPDQYLLPAIAHMGIDKDTTVIVYGEDLSGAARVVFALMVAGVEKVHLLHGGYAAWTAAGFAGETTTNQRVPVASFGLSTAARPELLVDTAFVQEVVAGDRSAVIADIRSHDEFVGATAPYGYIPTSGRIEGAVFAHAGEGPWDMSYFVNEDGTVKPYDAVSALWNTDGLSGEDHILFYCGTGWRAALTFLIAHAMGWDNLSLYDGGWFEWSMGPDAATNPVIDENPDLPAE